MKNANKQSQDMLLLHGVPQQVKLHSQKSGRHCNILLHLFSRDAALHWPCPVHFISRDLVGLKFRIFSQVIATICLEPRGQKDADGKFYDHVIINGLDTQHK